LKKAELRSVAKILRSHDKDGELKVRLREDQIPEGFFLKFF
jgi:hypothetical protein